MMIFSSAAVFGQVVTDSPADFSNDDGSEPRTDSAADTVARHTLYSVDKLLSGKLAGFFMRDTLAVASNENIFRTGLAVYNGRPVREIIITRVDIFAPSVMDTGYVSSTWVERTAKVLHTNTRKKVILSNLLFGKGDAVDDRLIMENEALIRRLPYIMDARFLIKVIPGSDSVDLQLLVKDVWSVGASGAVGGIGSGNASVWSQNIFGIGHNVSTTALWDNSITPVFGYKVQYGVPNIGGSFVSLTAGHTETYNEKSTALNVARDFRTTGLKYAGAANFERTSIIHDFNLRDSVLAKTASSYTIYDAWFGRMFRIYPPLKSRPTYLSVSARTANISFSEGPATSETYLSEFQDRTSLLFSMAVSRQSYRRDNYIYAFDRTEDVPSGFMLQLISGYEWGEFKERPYISGKLAAGSYIPAFGYIHGSALYSTYYYRGMAEQSLYNIQFRYFTDYYNNGFSGFRGFATFTWEKIMNQYSGQYISLENRSGIPGLRSPEMRGDEKYLLNLESDFFVSRKLAGFRSVVFLSADLGIVVRQEPEVARKKFFSGLGIGIRIRNDQLVFDTFEVKLSFYPGTPDGATPFELRAGSLSRLRMEGFYPGKPEPLGCGSFLYKN